jgi:soluble lytic murein transglycosylase-like protein
MSSRRSFPSPRAWRTVVHAAVVALALPAGAAHAQAAPHAAATGVDPAAAEEMTVMRLLRQEAAAHEHGEGVPRDEALAASLYCQAARLGDVPAQYALGWMHMNGRGVPRSDATAAFFFQIAAEQGDEAARRMLRTVGGPTTEVPACMREAPPPEPVVAKAPSAPPVPLTPASATELAARHGAPAHAPRHLVELAASTAERHGVAPRLVMAVVEAESNFDVVALSPRNARGLMQLIPETAARFGVANAFDPVQNLRGGTAYLRWLLARFEGDVALVAAAYNAGEGAVERYLGVPPYAETRAYVRKVLGAVQALRLPYDATAAAPSPQIVRLRALRTAAVGSGPAPR